jgi:hypothetical protein
MIRQSQSGSPYSTRHQEWFKYEILAPSDGSDQTVLRQQASVKWGKDNATRPWVVWKVIEKWEVEDIRNANRSIEVSIEEAAKRFNAGGVLYNTTIPEYLQPISIDQI